MESYVTLRSLEQALGAVVELFVLLDVFLTVLYAREGVGLFGDNLTRLTWRFFGWASRPFSHRRGVILSFCGPVILVLLVLAWAFGLTLGTALIIHPNLGTGVSASSGPTPTDFVTALYAGGSSLALVGASNFTPQTGAFRMVYLFNSLVGASVISLTLTYLMQVYTALQGRNTLGIKVHFLTGETGDAAELIAALGPRGHFDAGYSDLADTAVEMTQVKESHHFYPVLFYFRFREPYYSVSYAALVSLDTVTLISSALDDQQFAWLKESAAVRQLWRASIRLVTTLEDTFLPDGVPDFQPPPDAQTAARWRRRYFKGLRRLQKAGIDTVADEQAGADVYVSLRARWDHLITTLAPTMAYSMEEIDPASSDPDDASKR